MVKLVGTDRGISTSIYIIRTKFPILDGGIGSLYGKESLVHDSMWILMDRERVVFMYAASTSIMYF